MLRIRLFNDVAVKNMVIVLKINTRRLPVTGINGSGYGISARR